MENRIGKLQKSLNVPAVLISNSRDLFYLTGFDLEGYWLVAGKDEVFAVAPRLLAEQVSGLLPGIRVLGGNKMADLLAARLKKRKISELGIDPHSINRALSRQLSERMTLKDLPGTVSNLRQIKDEEEIAALRAACRLGRLAMDWIEGRIRPGMTERRIAFKIEEFYAKNMSRMSFLPIVASGPNSANPHHLPTDRKIEKDDIVTIDAGCVLNGYCSDLTRTFLFGKINQLRRTVHSLVAKAHGDAMRAVRPGIRASAVDRVARSIISAGGYGKNFIHSTGHGIGVEVHEAPRISMKDTTVLKPGMAITIEPGIYLYGQFGVRIEDTVLVTDKGYEVLT